MHSKPSNRFDDITEEQFDRRERDKADYRYELQKQMEDARAKK